VLVFQYGSNTSANRLNSSDRLRGDALDLGLARTEGTFELEFNVWSKNNSCAAADIRPGGSRPVWGVLYDVPDYLIRRETSGTRKSLDAIEGPSYERQPIVILRPNGSRLGTPVFTYRVRMPRQGLKTSLAYAAHILAGLREHGTPPDYLDYVRDRIVANNADLAESLKAL
jgi:hypothetical protein